MFGSAHSGEGHDRADLLFSHPKRDPLFSHPKSVDRRHRSSSSGGNCTATAGVIGDSYYKNMQQGSEGGCCGACFADTACAAWSYHSGAQGELGH